MRLSKKGRRLFGSVTPFADGVQQHEDSLVVVAAAREAAGGIEGLGAIE
jgi:hypothetical protein